MSPQVKRQAVDVLKERGLGVTRTCGLGAISRSLYRYCSRRADCAELRMRIEELAAVKQATATGASISCCDVKGGWSIA